MAYVAPQSTANVSQGSAMGTMPMKGTNLRDFPQLLDVSSALYLENYWLHGSGRLVKRKGITKRFDNMDGAVMSLDEEYQNNFEIVGYGQKVRAYDTSTGLFTDIKTDFTADNGGYTGVRTGDYFFVSNILDGLWRISMTLPYAQAQDLVGRNTFIITNASGTIGATITGVTSGATANVISSTGTTTLTVVVGTLSGNFTHGEAITSGTLASAILTNINPFTIGAKVTGGTSGAQGIVLESADAGATGTLTIGSYSGTFISGETITDNETVPGRGTLTAAMTFAITEVTDAPKAKIVAYINDRLLLLNLADNPAAWSYSDKDTSTNPPFTNWTTGSGFNDPGGGSFRNGQEGTGVETIGDIIFLSFEKGWHAFSIVQTDISGVVSKYDQVIQTSDLGIKKVKMTDVGLIACGDFGVKRLVSLGQPNVPFSEQWETMTEQLGEDYFDDVNFDQASIVYDDIRGYIYIACAKGGGTTNNHILAMKADLSGVESEVKFASTSLFTGLNPYRFLKKDGVFYFTSSLDGVSYQLFDGENDNGNEIYSQYYQELNFGTFTDTFVLDEWKCEGELSPASSLTVTFDIFNEDGYFDQAMASYAWTTFNSYGGGGGWGGAPWGSSGWGASGTSSGLVYDVAGATPKLRNLTRLRVRFECSDTADHIIALFSAKASIIAPTRNAKLTKL